MLTRIRNGQQAKKDSVLSPAFKLRARVLEVLQREGYIRGYRRTPPAPTRSCASS
jgi:small subunit ribosomal protein S8